jgi:hypothetical protein
MVHYIKDVAYDCQFVLSVRGDVNVDLEVSFDNLWKWKRIREIAGELNSRKACITNDDFPVNSQPALHYCPYNLRRSWKVCYKLGFQNNFFTSLHISLDLVPIYCRCISIIGDSNLFSHSHESFSFATLVPRISNAELWNSFQILTATSIYVISVVAKLGTFVQSGPCDGLHVMIRQNDW